jgi:glycosyltransferase involved in cell wall biosynthesis/2-polyprenyl-3-methyl-5-hydroxy-6-metoxy-1,4-benzoquinol methylase
VLSYALSTLISTSPMSDDLPYDRALDLENGSSGAKLLTHIQRGSKVLEIGPATGFMTRHMTEQLDCAVTCIELIPKLAEVSAKYCQRMIVENIESVDLEAELGEERFDYVIFADVLEHLVDPWSALQRVRKFLNPTGQCLASIPNVSYAGVVLELLSGTFHYRKEGSLDKTHLRFFTRETVKSLFEESGYEISLWDRTVLAPPSSEFKANLHSTPGHLRHLLQLNKDWDTYQFLVVAPMRSIDESEKELPRPEFTPAPVNPLLNLRQVQLFWATGEGFSEANSAVRFVKFSNELQHLEFDLVGAGQLDFLRFDPTDVEELFEFASLEVLHNGSRVFEWHSTANSFTAEIRPRFYNAEALTGLENPVQVALNEDPQIVTGNFSPLGLKISELKVKVTVRFFPGLTAAEIIRCLEQRVGEIASLSSAQTVRLRALEHEHAPLVARAAELEHRLKEQREQSNKEREALELAMSEVRLADLAELRHQKDEALSKAAGECADMRRTVEELSLELQVKHQTLEEQQALQSKSDEAAHASRNEIAQLHAALGSCKQAVDDKERHIQNVQAHIHELNALRAQAVEARDAVLQSVPGRIVAAIRKLSRIAKAPFRLAKRLMRHGTNLVERVNQRFNRLRSVQQREGLYGLAWRREAQRALEKPASAGAYPLDEAAASTPQYVPGQLAYEPRISIILPTYNSDPAFLNAAIDSVLAQTYPHWELCIADDCSTAPHVRGILEGYAAKDPRVRIVFRAQNGHISAASNSALEIATGEFLALLDHDDTLMPFALLEVTALLNQDRTLDIIYSNEDKIDTHGNRSEPTFKGGWSPDYFTAFMYMGHLAVYRSKVVRTLGGFRKGFEGSQDYDLALRVTEKTSRIAHIPKVLYNWRMHPESVAQNLDCKPYAFVSAQKALTEALRRRGFANGDIHQTPFKGLYRPRYPFGRDARVSVFLLSDDRKSAEESITELRAKTEFQGLEILALSSSTAKCFQVRKFGDRDVIVEAPRGCTPTQFWQYGCKICSSPVVLLLDGKLTPHNPDWLESMLEHALRPEVGAVGAKLVSFDGWVLHAGYSIIDQEMFSNFFASRSSDVGYAARLVVTNNVSAVSSKCLMIRRKVLEKTKILESEYRTVEAFEADLGLSLLREEKRILTTPYAQLILQHSPFKSRVDLRKLGADFVKLDSRHKLSVFVDPYYPKGLTSGIVRIAA